MNNFLSRLISKSLVGAAEIQPRPVSLFEPSSNINSPVLEHPLKENEPNRADILLGNATSISTSLIHTPSIPDVSSPATRPQIESSPTPPTSHSIASINTIAPNSSPARFPSFIEATHSPVSFSQPEHSTVSTETSTQLSLDQLQHSMMERLQPSITTDSPSPQTYSQPEHSTVSTEISTQLSLSPSPQTYSQQPQNIPSSISEVFQPSVESLSLEEILATIQPSPATSVRTLAQPQVKPLGQTETCPNPPQSSQPPTIRVTIGRIDVQAVTPPTPSPSRRSPPAPKLSLADYLKQRPGGKG